MKHNTTARWLPFRGVYQRIPLLLAVLCVIASLATVTVAHAAETGIRGTVMWGPVKPGPSKVGQKEEAPLRASFTVFEAEQKVAQFESERTGCFIVSLPPGVYTIVPDKGTPIPFPAKQKTQVTVPEEGFADVTIRLHTGMK